MHTFIKLFLAGLSLFISSGLCVHDTHASSIVAARSTASFIDGHLILVREGHTHSDQTPSQSLLSSFTYQSPTLHPRENRHFKQLLQKFEQRGHHAFDNPLLPIIA